GIEDPLDLVSKFRAEGFRDPFAKRLACGIPRGVVNRGRPVPRRHVGRGPVVALFSMERPERRTAGLRCEGQVDARALGVEGEPEVAFLAAPRVEEKVQAAGLALACRRDSGLADRNLDPLEPRSARIWLDRQLRGQRIPRVL